MLAFFAVVHPAKIFSFAAYPAPSQDSVKLDRQKIFAFALDGEIKKALQLLEVPDTNLLGERDRGIKRNFENRFLRDDDLSGYADSHKSQIDSLLALFVSYWRASFLHPETPADSAFGKSLAEFLSLRLNTAAERIMNEDSLSACLLRYIKSKNLLSTGFGRTGKFLDLLVWRTQYDTLYNFCIHDDTVSVKVVFMDGFVTLGWEEYATFGISYPGGWADSTGLYCVKSAYDLQSENFLVSYLAHEGRHYKDYKLFPVLSGADLEYRAKLTELSLANKSIYDLLKFFINNANYESSNSHSVANYCAIRDLSRELFSADFEKDIEKWKTAGVDAINQAAYKILSGNTEALKKLGRNVKEYIKPK